MDLETYLRESGKSMLAFGADLGVSHTTIHRWLAGRARPDWKNLEAIERATGGRVTAYDFMHPQPKEAGEKIDRRKPPHRLKRSPTPTTEETENAPESAGS